MDQEGRPYPSSGVSYHIAYENMKVYSEGIRSAFTGSTHANQHVARASSSNDTHLGEPNGSRLFTETLTAKVETVLAD